MQGETWSLPWVNDLVFVHVCGCRCMLGVEESKSMDSYFKKFVERPNRCFPVRIPRTRSDLL